MSEIQTRYPESASQARRIFIPLLTLIFTAALFYEPLLSLDHCMKYDIMDQFFQYRYFLSDSLSNGVWPLWVPWQHYGFPYFADPQGAAWYAPGWILAAIRDYDIYSLHFEWWGLIVWSSIGMFVLLRQLKISVSAALIIAIFFQGNGLFLGNAQHLSYVVAMAWLPWVVYASSVFLQKPHFRSALGLALAFYFLVTGGYPAFTIISAYIFGCALILKMYQYNSKGTLEKIKPLLLYTLLFAGLLLFLIGPYLYSVLEGTEKMIRSGGISLEDALFGPFPTSAVASMVHPLPVTAPPELFGADRSMINGFIGLLPLLVLPLAWRTRANRLSLWSILALGLFCLLASFGDSTPIRTLLYHLPFMDLFRFPSVFRAFWMIATLILGGYGLHHLLARTRTIPWSLLFGAVLVIASFLTFLPYSGEWGWPDLQPLFRILRGKLNFHEESYAEESQLFGITTLSILSFLTLYVLAARLSPKWKSKLFIGLAIIEVFLAIRWALPHTVVHSRPGTAYQAALSTVPDDYPIPDQTPLHKHRPADPRFLPSWYNNNVFTKTVSPIGLNPFKFKSLDIMEKVPCYDTALQHPLIFSTSDSELNYKILDWYPGHLELNINVSHPDTLVVQQALYPGWSATVDRSSAKLTPWCGHLLSLPVPAGESQITVSFQRPDIKVLWIWQGIMLLMGSIFLMLPYFRKN